MTLKKNDVVDVVSLGTACTSDEVKKIKNFVIKVGLTPNIFLEKETTLKQSTTHEFPSCKPSTRFEQLKRAIENPQSKIIWCSRGGYGSAEILPFLQKLKKPRPREEKIFVGFSDISSLNIFLIQEWGWKIIYAPMLAQLALGLVSEKSEKAILDLIFGKTKELKYKLKSVNVASQFCVTCSIDSEEESEISTEIVGGCLSVIAGHFGTKNQIDWKGKILFLEDEGEDGERLDRYFRQITEIILEKKSLPAAILFGNFSESNLHGTPKAKNISIALKKFAQNLANNNLEIPLFEEAKTEKSLGHSKNMLPLILGAKAKISDGILTLPCYF